ncbi:hypothetical protein MNBD_ALPHA11-1628 [hydrothermal vent metagenome]|uniref:Uncharacterized protein n=1 Tax=hydrothermal vent metagenome TaxID=652676 RepID=A0A3B0TSZ8_9ZZZZ
MFFSFFIAGHRATCILGTAFKVILFWNFIFVVSRSLSGI